MMYHRRSSYNVLRPAVQLVCGEWNLDCPSARKNVVGLNLQGGGHVDVSDYKRMHLIGQSRALLPKLTASCRKSRNVCAGPGG